MCNHLLRHTRDVLDSRVAEHAHEVVNPAKVALDRVVRLTRAHAALLARWVLAHRELAILIW